MTAGRGPGRGGAGGRLQADQAHPEHRADHADIRDPGAVNHDHADDDTHRHDTTADTDDVRHDARSGHAFPVGRHTDCGHIAHDDADRHGVDDHDESLELSREAGDNAARRLRSMYRASPPVSVHL